MSLKTEELIFPELSYQIIGCAYEVYNQLGAGHPEKVYHNAYMKEFELKKLSVESEVYFPVHYKDEIVGKNFFDFLVEGKIIVEIKQGYSFSKKRFDQVLRYLRASNLQLALLIVFGSTRVTSKRILNINK